jgi:hypothetical protein
MQTTQKRWQTTIAAFPRFGKHNYLCDIISKAMKTKNIPFFIDILFCVILLPVMTALLPIERWLAHNNYTFVVILSVWLYIVYFTMRHYCMPMLFQSRKKMFIALLVIAATIAVTALIVDYNFDFPDRGRHSSGRRNFSRMLLLEKGVWLLYVVVFCFSTAVGMLSELSRQIIARQAIEHEKNKAELALYKAQINPHFLFNTLNTLYGLLVTKSEKAETAFMQFISLMKYMYSNATKDKIPLEMEIDYIEQYIELQKNRMNENVTVSFEKHTDAASSVMRIAPMLLITFVENALKYGISSTKKSNIFISVEATEGNLVFRTENPIFTHVPDEKKGIGISNCRKRMALLYPKRHRLDIEETDDYYKVTLQIKLD